MPTTSQPVVESIAKIERASLGWEDHGIFTCMLQMDYGGSGQGVGGYALDTPRKDAQGKSLGRFGTAYGMEFIARVMKAAGVSDWSELKGRTVLVVREEGWNGKVLGLKPLPTEPGEAFIFDDLLVEFPDGA